MSETTATLIVDAYIADLRREAGWTDGRRPARRTPARRPSNVPEPSLEWGLRDAGRGGGAYADEFAASIASAASM